MIPLNPFHFEISGGEPGGDPAGAAAEGEGQEGAGAPEWLQSEEFQQAVDERAGRAAEAQLTNLLASLDQGQGGPQLDPLADDFQQQLDAYIQQQLAPLSQFADRSSYQEGESRSMDIIHDLEAQHGEFLGKPGEGESLAVDSAHVARNLADSFYPQMAERHGDGPKAAEAALAQAVETVRALEQTIGKAYATREQNQLHTLAGARREPGAAGAQGAGEIQPGVGSETELVNRFFPRR